MLTWHCDHGGAGPENIHACGVTVAQWGVQAHVRQLASPHVLLFGGYGGEDGAGAGQTHVLGVLLDVWLADGGETEKPQHAVGDALQDLPKRGRGGEF